MLDALVRDPVLAGQPQALASTFSQPLQPKKPSLPQLRAPSRPHFFRVIAPVSIAPTVASTAITTRTQRRPGSLRRRELRRLPSLEEVTGKNVAGGILAAAVRSVPGGR